MKLMKHLSLASLVGVVLCTGQVYAQTDATPTAIRPERVGRVVTPDRPKGNLDPATAADSTSMVRPNRIDANRLTPEVADAITKFREEANRYMRQQDELRKRLLGAATDAERERIREMVRVQRENWLERARSLREEFRERQKELLQRLPNRREMLREAAQDNLRSIRDNAQDQIKRRRGDE